ncbi:acylneuraminate cytidylyltransferase family protein [Synechococcus sp. AH-601-N10]|nr:acylneuraminate cytidylyltransferase family protein [Synechococcus sp. AH-601-N10]
MTLYRSQLWKIKFLLLSMKRIAIIPARGGSKRLPRKNILPIDGKPVICWTIEAALNSCIFDKILVSSEDDEILSIVKDYPVDACLRPSHLASDIASVSEVCFHHLDLLLKDKLNYDQLFCLYPTAPLRDASDLSEMAKIFAHHSDAQAVIAVSKYMHYPHQAFASDENMKISPYWPNLQHLRADKLPTMYAGNGSTYAILVEEFLKTLRFVPSNGVYGYPMSLMNSIDIDTKEDFQMLECIVNYRKDKIL